MLVIAVRWEQCVGRGAGSAQTLDSVGGPCTNLPSMLESFDRKHVSDGYLSSEGWVLGESVSGTGTVGGAGPFRRSTALAPVLDGQPQLELSKTGQHFLAGIFRTRCNNYFCNYAWMWLK